MRLSLLSRLRDRHLSRGQGVVEFALVVPILIFLLLATIDLGRLFASYVTLTNTTRVAANFGATSPAEFTGSGSSPTYDALVLREAEALNCDLLADADGNVPPVPKFPGGTNLNATSLAEMSCDFTLLTPLLTGFFGGPMRISAASEFPIRTGAIANVGGSTTLPPPGAPSANFDFVSISGGTLDGSGNVTGVEPVTVNVSNTSLNAQTWQWQWGDSSPDEFEQTPVAHTYASPGTYIVTLTVTNTSGSSIRQRTVTVAPSPTATAPTPNAGFYGTPVTGAYFTGGGSSGTLIAGTAPLVVDFTNTSTSGNTYAWDFGDGQTSTSTSPQHQFSSLGMFTVTLTITDPVGGSPSARSNYVTVGCQVPNFANTLTNAATSAWTGASFTGDIRFREDGKTGNGSKTPPSLPKNIVRQSLAGGDFYAPTKNGSNPWRCDYEIIVDYTP